MIYTVTLNPALDYHIKIDQLKIDHLNIINDASLRVAGKGINVSRLLNNLQVDNIALGIVGGVSGKMILDDLNANHIRNDFIISDQIMTRINIKIRTDKETELNHLGPSLTSDTFKQLLKKIEMINEGDHLVLSGSQPPSFTNLYPPIIEKLIDKNIRLYIDTRKDNLLDCLKYKPFLIKPNLIELQELCSYKLNDLTQMIKCIKSLHTKGAQNILLSLNKDGAILFTSDDQIYKALAPAGKLVSSVGSGDAMLAGFIASYIKDHSFKEALRYAIATGSASAFKMGLANKDEIECLIDKIDVKKIK
ncbi:MAG: 1-phosphofructokinase family hexose kinase [Erysipelotrichaceae bacterium]|nr:1-phosphofructokinase family hexose kinase [Erysipelotrichaceae bacterium]